MLKTIINKINKSKLYSKPFPFFIINNLLNEKDLKKLNKVLPNFEEIKEQDIYFQSKSGTKKTLLQSSIRYKKLTKNNSFNKVNVLFRKLKPFIIKKFKKSIKNFVKEKFYNSKLSYHSTFSVMKNGYVKSPHLDRRDHLVHILFYPSSESDKGGRIQIMSLKKHKKTYDIFPDLKNLKLFKSYKVKNNFCLITLNVPWAYHSVSKYYGKKDRKFFYIVYDFPSNLNASKLKNQKKGNNQNQYWKYKVSVESSNRKKIFFSE